MPSTRTRSSANGTTAARDLAAAAVDAAARAEDVDIATAAVKAVPEAKKAAIAAAAVDAAPDENKADVAAAAVHAVPDARKVDTLTSAIKNAPHRVSQQVALLTVFTTSTGILAGFISGRASTSKARG